MLIYFLLFLLRLLFLSLLLMTISKLPLEIFLVIGDFLGTNDQKECSLVCKIWKETFQRVLWKELKISSHDWIFRFHKCVKRGALTEKGRYVQSIKVVDLDSPMDTLIPMLIRRFPNVKKFEHKRAETYNDHFVQTNFSGWKLLTHMSIEFDTYAVISDPLKLFEALSVLPSLTHLTLSQTHHSVDRKNFTWRTLEKLHYYLPRLQYLKCWMCLQKIDYVEIKEFTKVKPAKAIKSIYFGFDSFDGIWMYFISSIYPLLETFDLMVEEGSIEPTPSDQKALDRLLALPPFCPFLKRIYLKTYEVDGMQMSFILNNIAKSGAKIEHIEISCFINLHAPVLPANQTACTQLFSESLKSLRLIAHSYDECMTFGDFSDLGAHGFSNLVHLRIYCDYEEFGVEDILYGCQSLIELELDNAQLSVNKDFPKHTTALRHGLLRLKLFESLVQPGFFEYISNYCRQLEYFSLKDVEIESPTFEEPEYLAIRMPFTQLSTLLLINLKMYTNSNLLSGTVHIRPDSTLSDEEDGHLVEVYLSYSRTGKIYTHTTTGKLTTTWDRTKNDVPKGVFYFRDYSRERNRIYRAIYHPYEGLDDDVTYTPITGNFSTALRFKSIKQVIIDKTNIFL
ncbi:secreted F-box domain-containing protein [Phycomyces blakesleeanus]